MEIGKIYFGILSALFILSLTVLMLLNIIALSFSSSLKVPEDKRKGFINASGILAIIQLLLLILSAYFYNKGNRSIYTLCLAVLFFIYIINFFQNHGFENVVQESLTTNEKNIVKSILKLNYVPFIIFIIILLSFGVAYMF
jgi:hypothetical protein